MIVAFCGLTFYPLFVALPAAGQAFLQFGTSLEEKLTLSVKGACAGFFRGPQPLLVRHLPSDMQCRVVVKSASRASKSARGRRFVSLQAQDQAHGERSGCLIIPEFKNLGLAPLNRRGKATFEVKFDKSLEPYRYQLFARFSSPAIEQCASLVEALVAEESRIRTCRYDEDCGQVLNTSCGCTRNKVAAKDADAVVFYELLSEVMARHCDNYPTITVCDCPPANGFKCENGLCKWNYAGAW